MYREIIKKIIVGSGRFGVFARFCTCSMEVALCYNYGRLGRMFHLWSFLLVSFHVLMWVIAVAVGYCRQELDSSGPGSTEHCQN